VDDDGFVRRKDGLEKCILAVALFLDVAHLHRYGGEETATLLAENKGKSITFGCPIQ
jgi:hypothetical protein